MTQLTNTFLDPNADRGNAAECEYGQLCNPSPKLLVQYSRLRRLAQLLWELRIQVRRAKIRSM
jgi:hypothetical protein